MEEEVIRLPFYPQLADARYHAGEAGHYPAVVAAKYGASNEEVDRMNARMEQPSQVIPEEHSEAHIIVMEPNRLYRERSIMAPKVCKGLLWIQMAIASLICLVWCLAQLK